MDLAELHLKIIDRLEKMTEEEFTRSMIDSGIWRREADGSVVLTDPYLDSSDDSEK